MTHSLSQPAHRAHHLTHPKYRADIDGLRAIAVLSVVGYHAFPGIIPSGFIGVDIFFVISGYLISSIIFSNLEHDSFSLAEFYIRRIKRIFPALLFVLISCFIFGWFFLLPDEFKQYGKHVTGGASFVSNFLLWKESGYFDSAAETKPLLHLWSLAIEEQFYIFWPLLLALVWKRKWSFVAITIAVAAISFSVNIYAINHKPIAAFYLPVPRFWELMIGGLLAYVALHRQHINSQHKNAQSIIGVGLLLLGLMLINKERAFPGWWALLPTLGAFFIISAGSQAWLNKLVFSNKILVWIGLISYPLYLWHWPLLAVARIVEGKNPSPEVIVAVVVAAFILAWLTLKLIEKPIRFGKYSKAKSIVLLGSMLIVGGVGYYVFKNEGIASRFTATPLQQTDAKYDCIEQQNNTGKCVFGNLQSQKLILIYGDSHAGHLTKALNDAVGDKYKIEFVFSGSCFFGEKVEFTPKTAYNKAECDAMRASLLDRPKDEIFAVIRSQRWHGYGIEEKSDIEKAVIDAANTFSLKPQKTIIVGSSGDVNLSCEMSNYYALPLRSKKCDTFENIKTFNKAFIDTTKSMTVAPNVHFVYPYEHLCPNDICQAINGTQLNYVDRNHFSEEGALLVMPDILRILGE